jgi:ubiquinone/menaquinone biosynthesis C-methylase UbiE
VAGTGDSQLQDRFGLRFPLIHASAERAPLAEASFDLAISGYGASIWCDPDAWIPEAARLLRDCGLEVEDHLELRPGPDATTRYPFVTLDWARKWPCEEVRKARKPA